MRGETHSQRLANEWRYISIHSPHARRDLHKVTDKYSHQISIHSPHARRDHMRCFCTEQDANFNPLSSCEERPILKYSMTSSLEFQSTFLMRGETIPVMESCYHHVISIHSPHARRDLDYAYKWGDLNISIHSPHARRDYYFC